MQYGILIRWSAVVAVLIFGAPFHLLGQTGEATASGHDRPVVTPAIVTESPVLDGDYDKDHDEDRDCGARAERIGSLLPMCRTVECASRARR